MAAAPALALGWGVVAEGLFWTMLPVALAIWGLSLRQFARAVPPAPLRPLLAIHLAPAALLALSARYQQPEAITWKWGYIPAAASSVGLGLLLAAGVAALAELCCRLSKVP